MKLEADDPSMGSGKAWCALPIDEKISLLPEEIRPAAPFKGQWSYIVHSPNNLAAVQVLLKPRAFFLKTDCNGQRFVGSGRTIAWKRFGWPEAAWEAVKNALTW